MAIPSAQYPSQGLTRSPGDFWRADGGTPWVLSMTETRRRQGLKPELLATAASLGISVPDRVTVEQLHELLGPEPRRVPYGRPSGLGKQIENTTGLQKWAERAVALGCFLATYGEDQDSYDHADPFRDLYELDETQYNLDDDEARGLLDAIAAEAKRTARANLAAERGTHTHALTEDSDDERDWVERARSGEDLGLPHDVQAALVAAWDQMVAEWFDILAVEARCVDDRWRQAGTLDRIARLRKSRTFVVDTGETVTLDAGWTGVLDVKTGKLRLDNGRPQYWHTYAPQVASYAQSVPYDTETDTRGTWPWLIDQRWGIIAHLDVLAALDGAATCRLILVDLAAGRLAGDLAVAAKAWEKRRDVFSVVTDDDAVVVPVNPAPVAAAAPAGDGGSDGAAVPNTAAPSSIAVPGPGGPVEQPAGAEAPQGVATPPSSAPAPLGRRARASASPTAQMVAADDAERQALRARHQAMRESAVKTGWVHQFDAQMTALGVGPNSSNAEVAAALDAIEPPFDVVTEPAPPRAVAPAPAVERPERADPAAIAALVDAIRTGPRDVVNAWVAQGSWSPLAPGADTVANFERTRAALALAVATDGDEDCTRMLLATAMIAGDAELHVHSIGAWIGSLTVPECARVIALAEAFGPVLGLRYDDAGRPHLDGDVAAVLGVAA